MKKLQPLFDTLNKEFVNAIITDCKESSLDAIWLQKFQHMGMFFEATLTNSLDEHLFFGILASVKEHQQALSA